MADKLGALPEGVWGETASSKQQRGSVVTISERLFEAVWKATRCVNDA